jgi:TonB family protein
MHKRVWLLAIAAAASMSSLSAAAAAGKSCASLSQPPTDLEIVDNPISKSAPRYPRDAVSKSLKGFVRLKVTISPQGEVTDVQVVKAEPPGVFEQAALEAVKTWKFCAAGRTITLQLDMKFELPPELRIHPE